MSRGPDTACFHGGETTGYNSQTSYDPTNPVTLVVWTNPAVSLDDEQTANLIRVKVLDRIDAVSPRQPPPSPPQPVRPVSHPRLDAAAEHAGASPSGR